MRKISIDGFKRVNRGTAKKLFEEGKSVYGVPCNLRPSVGVCALFDKNNGTFESIENAIMYYNCNSETGKTLWFYIPWDA